MHTDTYVQSGTAAISAPRSNHPVITLLQATPGFSIFHFPIVLFSLAVKREKPAHMINAALFSLNYTTQSEIFFLKSCDGIESRYEDVNRGEQIRILALGALDASGSG